MKTLRYVFAALVLIGLGLSTGVVYAQEYERDFNDPGDQNDYYNNQPAIDRYLDIEVWTDHSDADYYVNDEVVIHFRANRDAFIAIYSIDSRGMVNLLFPAEPAQDNYVRGGVTYSLPGPADDFELVLNGPEGTETIQVIASQERFPIPDWYRNSGLLFEGDDIYDYMDYLNGRHFVRYGGQRFAYDRAVVFVNEWEPSYFQPVYYPTYPSWAVVGNVYVDYAWGSTVYINGSYWGVTPLYVPRILVGWHTMTIYDRYGSCWEQDFHVSRYNTSVFNHNVIVTAPAVRSKYKQVRNVGYRDPVANGYVGYNKVVTGFKASVGISGSKIVTKQAVGSGKASVKYVASKKRYVRGDSKLVKTDRGFETRSTSVGKSGSRSASKVRSYAPGKTKARSSGTSGSYSSGSSRTSKSSGKAGSYKSTSTKSRSGSSGDYYKRKSGASGSSKAQGSQSGKTVRNRSKAKTSSPSKPAKSSSRAPTIKKSKESKEKQSASKSSESKVSKSSAPKSKQPAVKSSSGKRSSSSNGKSKKRR